MSIEVKQLVIKSSIVDDEDEQKDDADEALITLKQEVLKECRKLFADMMKEKGRR
jgi:Family of unknown function (DUF5908)